MPKCIPCLHPKLKELIAREFQSEDLSWLKGVADCRQGVVVELCGGRGRGAGKRAPSAYNLFVGECFKRHGVKSFGQAGGVMKQCAAEWRARKK